MKIFAVACLVYVILTRTVTQRHLQNSNVTSALGNGLSGWLNNPPSGGGYGYNYNTSGVNNGFNKGIAGLLNSTGSPGGNGSSYGSSPPGGYGSSYGGQSNLSSSYSSSNLNGGSGGYGGSSGTLTCSQGLYKSGGENKNYEVTCKIPGGQNYS